MKKHRVIKLGFIFSLLMSLIVLPVYASDEYVLNEGINVIKEGQVGKSFKIDEGKAVMIEGRDDQEIVFKDCSFDLSGKTMKISGDYGVSYHNGETATKLFVGKNVRFDHCTFIGHDGGRGTTAGWDACLYLFSGDIVFKDCKVTGTNWQGQFMGLYGSKGSVDFYNCDISTVDNTGGWSYAMYGGSVLKLNQTTMKATSMNRFDGGSNVNAFYSGDNKTQYDAIYMKDSLVDFSDNDGGGFAINHVNIHVDDSIINVNNNLGNACNSGYWIVNNSKITMNGNKGGHALSCVGIDMKNSNLEILHNGYAGLYIQSIDSSFVNSKVNIRCNGERLLSYSGGDVWLNTHTALFKDCSYVWLGGVGRKGNVVNENCQYFVAYDLYENKTKGNTEPVLDNVKLDEQDSHTLFLNPDLDFDYARGNTEGKAGNSNDDDLFADVTKEKAISKESAKIGTLTTSQLSHHDYNWENGKVTDQANLDNYGVMRYECEDVCLAYKDNTSSHAHSFDCKGTYVYAPLVGLAFDPNVSKDEGRNIKNLPDNQNTIQYNQSAIQPSTNPTREGYVFKGWYLDKECTKEYDFDTQLIDNYTIVYAKWLKKTSLQLKATKKLTGRELKENEFQFELKTKDGTVVSSAKNQKDGQIIFDQLTYDKAGDYQYTLSEIKGNDTNIEYDDTIYNITIHVEDINNELQASIKSPKQSFIFHNTYTAIPWTTIEPSQPKEDEVLSEVIKPDTSDTIKIEFMIVSLMIASASIFLLRRKS